MSDDLEPDLPEDLPVEDLSVPDEYEVEDTSYLDVTDEAFLPFDGITRTEDPTTDDGLPGADEARGVTFDSRHRLDFEGLLYLGALKRQFTWMGHRFEIRTLKVDEILEVALLHRDFMNTMGEVKAYQAAVVAACLISVDGQPPPIPITDDSGSLVATRFDYVRRNWFPVTLDAIYQQYLILEAKVEEVMVSLGEARGRSPAQTSG